jgi:two-component system, NarL family, nitrate/nitrite sensor histidine kinase NarX
VATNIAKPPLTACSADASASASGEDGRANLLRELAADLASADDLPDLLARFLTPLLRIAGADAGAVRAISPDGEQLHLVSSVGLTSTALRGAWTTHRDCGACGSAASLGAATWAHAQSACPQLGMAGHSGGDFRRMLAVPLKHRGQVLGVYNLFFLRDDGAAPQALTLLDSVGDLLGLALNNARLEQAQLRAALMSERQAMAAEVHDSIAQNLTYVKMRMPLLQGAIAEHDEPNAQRYAADVRRGVSDAHTALRELLTNFRAPIDPLGLSHALRAGIGEFEASTGIDVVFEDGSMGLELSSLQQAQLSRIAKEALTNVARHANAPHTWLRIGKCDDGVEIIVEDDGRGVPPDVDDDANASHYGIHIMRQRAARLGGQFQIGARAGGGTRVRVWAPLGAAASAVRP